MSLKKNVIANFSGSIWLALMGLVFVPFYIDLMGVESYGVVGIFVTLQAVFLILDMGLTQSISRELARLSVIEGGFQRMAATFRTMEMVYWGVAVLVAVCVALLSYPIAFYWVNTEGLTKEQVLRSLLLIALVIGLRWPVSLYIGGLNGLQRQVEVNKYMAVFATVQGVGALAVLRFIAPTLITFFSWQAFVAAIQFFYFRRCIAQAVGLKSSVSFDFAVLREIWRFAAGMTGISLLTTVLTQLDKILLSKVLSLKEFGFYMFAATVASVIVRAVAPLFTAYSPKLTALVAHRQQEEEAKTYHQGCQLMAVLIVPAALVFVFFGYDIVLFWTRDVVLAKATSMIVALLVLGNMFNGFMTIPYALQLAHGWTRLALYQNIIGVLFLAPAIYFLSREYGGLGAAFAWMLLNLGYLSIGAPFMYLRIMRGHGWRWLFFDILLPTSVALVLLMSVSALLSNDFGIEIRIILVGFSWAFSVLLALLCSRDLVRYFPFAKFLG